MEHSAIIVSWANQPEYYITFPAGEVEARSEAADGYSKESLIALVESIARNIKTEDGERLVFQSISYAPLIDDSILDVSFDACREIGPFVAFARTPQAVVEGDEPFTTDVVNGDLDDAETAFNS